MKVARAEPGGRAASRRTDLLVRAKPPRIARRLGHGTGPGDRGIAGQDGGTWLDQFGLTEGRFRRCCATRSRGGMAAWTGALEHSPTRPTPGDFVGTPREELRADRDEVKRAAVVLDVREPGEFAGSNGYLAAYGGHVPGAENLPWRAVAAGATPSRAPDVVYCTGGVRSAFVWMLLSSAGVSVANYDGSWWDWAAHEPPPR